MSFTVYFAALMYAITGGPSSGKSSIIKELEKQGETVIHEAATDLIIDKIESGVQEPWKEGDFQLNILKMQLEREEPYLSSDGRIFVDRGLFDGYTYAMEQNLAGTQTLASLNELLNPIDLNQRYKAIFFVLPYETNFSPHQSEVRRENSHNAAKLEVATYALYCRHKHFIIVPGGLTPQERADFILGKIDQMDE